jgi:hypothetical protein
MRVRVKLSTLGRRRPFLDFRSLFGRSGISAITWGNIRVRIKLSDACPFSPDVARFHVFALRLAVFKCFRYNTGHRTSLRQVKRHLNVFDRRRPFPHVRPSRVFSRFRWNTGQRTCPHHVKRCLPVFARCRPFPRFRPSLSSFQPFPL